MLLHKQSCPTTRPQSKIGYPIILKLHILHRLYFGLNLPNHFPRNQIVNKHPASALHKNSFRIPMIDPKSNKLKRTMGGLFLMYLFVSVFIVETKLVFEHYNVNRE
jgi:hypothetical protein